MNLQELRKERAAKFGEFLASGQTPHSGAQPKVSRPEKTAGGMFLYRSIPFLIICVNFVYVIKQLFYHYI